MKSVDLRSLWAFVCSVHLCSSVRKNMSFFFCHYVILSKKVLLSRPVPLLFCLQDHPFCYLCPPVTLSSKLPCLLCHNVILSKIIHLSCPVPLLFCLQDHPFCYLCPPVTLSSKLPCLLCHNVILSKIIHLSCPVPLLFCLQDHPFCYSCPPVTLSSKLPCLPLSLCHSVFKTTPVSPRPPVILSSKTTLSGYLYYYIYPACDRLFCVVPLHRHQE